VVARGLIEARYIPTLLLAVATGGALLHGVYFVSRDELSIGGLVSYLGLMQLLRFPTFISLFTFSLVQLGKVSAERILDVMNAETELDQNTAGHEAAIEGRIEFRNVGFRTPTTGKRHRRPELRRRAGRDHRDRRGDRLGQEHADEAGQPDLRRGRGRDPH
jgi:ABC-type multidrug transport system fused ATPase/permease subunit